ncbi:MAG: hypothetical protein ACQGVC_20255, partial [Myxococcota bacterium]
MDLSSRFALDGAVWASWALQLVLIGWVTASGGGRAGRGRIGLPHATLGAALLVVAAGWIWRLVYAFVLASGGFRFWIGDDAVRWLNAWRWSQEPFLLLPGDPWLVGPYVLHGSAMALLGDPILATRLLASALCVLPLVGVFLLAQALYRSPAVSALSAAILAPHWLHVLLGTGTMTELPLVGLLLGGLALQLIAERDGTRAPAWAGALCLALATSLHMVAWILTAVVQLGLLWAALRSDRGPLRGRLLAWAGPAALSG